MQHVILIGDKIILFYIQYYVTDLINKMVLNKIKSIVVMHLRK